jgi:hypothetical protein
LTQDGFQATESIDKAVRKEESKALAFGDRLERNTDEVQTSLTGSRSITFQPKSKVKKAMGEPKRERRSASKAKLSGK